MRVGISTAAAQREIVSTIVSTGSCVGVRVCPNPTGRLIGGNHKSNWATSPAT